MEAVFSSFRVVVFVSSHIDFSIPQVSFNGPLPSLNLSSFMEGNIYQFIRSIRLPTQLSIVDYNPLLLNEAKKVSASVVQYGGTIAKAAAELNKRQQQYEDLMNAISGHPEVIQDIHQLILQDFSLAHKCYKLPIPVLTVEEKTTEEGTTVSIFGTHGSRKNSNNFLSLLVVSYSLHYRFSHRKATKGDTSVSASSTAHSFATGTSDSGVMDHGSSLI